MSKRQLIIILIVNIFIKGILIFYPIDYFEGKTTIDDTFYSLSIAKSITKGNGPFISENYTNGFQPLYVFLVAPIFLINDDEDFALKFSLLLLLIFDTLSLLIIYNITVRKKANSYEFIILSLFWMINPYIIKTTLNGLETIIAFFFLLLLFYYYKYNFNNDLFYFVQIGIIAGLTILSRVDSIIFVFIIYLFLFFNKLTQIKYIIYSILIAFLVVSPWLTYSYSYTGDLYNISGKAVRLMSIAELEKKGFLEFYYELTKRLLIEIIYNYKGFIILLILGLYFIIKNKIKTNILRENTELLFYSLILIMSYLIYLPAYWFYSRYLFPMMIVALIISTDLIEIILRNNKIKIIIAIIPLFLIIINFKELKLLYNYEDYKGSYRKFALYLDRYLPKNSKVGASQSGALNYYSKNLKILNLDGVVNKNCYISLLNKTNMDYIKSEKVDFIVGWEDNIDYIKQKTSNFNYKSLIFVKKIEDYNIWKQNWYIYKVNYE